MAVYNGSQTPDLAEKTTAYLQAQGANVIATGAADNQYSATTIIDYTGNPYTIQFLADMIGNPYVKILSQFDLASPVDVEIFLGTDWARSNTLP